MWNACALGLLPGRPAISKLGRSTLGGSKLNLFLLGDDVAARARDPEVGIPVFGLEGARVGRVIGSVGLDLTFPRPSA